MNLEQRTEGKRIAIQKVPPFVVYGSTLGDVHRFNLWIKLLRRKIKYFMYSLEVVWQKKITAFI